MLTLAVDSLISVDYGRGLYESDLFRCIPDMLDWIWSCRVWTMGQFLVFFIVFLKQFLLMSCSGRLEENLA